MRTLPLLAVSTLLTALPAQVEQAPFRFVPGNSALVVRMAAPAKWQQRFAQTQVAKLADGETMGPLMAQMRKGFDDAIEQLRQSGEFDADLVEQLVTKYQGDIVMSVQVDFAKLMAALEDGAPPPVSVVLAWRTSREMPSLRAFRAIALTVGEEFMAEQAITRLRR